MKKFFIERDLSGAGNLTDADLKSIAIKSCEVVNSLDEMYHMLPIAILSLNT